VSDESLSVRLADGRRLSYAEYGASGGRPLLLFHGTPSSRLMFRLADRAACDLGMRLIAPDRPGIGMSDPQAGRRIADWPADVAGLADQLGCERFDLVGVSGGGPYALACARFIPERLGTVGVVSGVGPVGDSPELKMELEPRLRALFALAQRGGAPYELAARIVGATARRWPALFLNMLALNEPQAERTGATGDPARRVLEAGLVEAFRQGHHGPAEDFRLIASPWGFDPEEVRCRVLFWHGEADTIVPLEMGRHLARRMTEHGACWVPGAGHLFGIAHADAIIGAFAAKN
jgi:pimeloyl-ACP methyl ester carboxylesterase